MDVVVVMREVDDGDDGDDDGVREKVREKQDASERFDRDDDKVRQAQASDAVTTNEASRNGTETSWTT